MDAEAFDRLLASVPSLSWLDLTGGEISARSDILELVAIVHRRLPRLLMLHFPTGGMQPDRVEAVARAMAIPGGPRVVVTVSFDGPPELHDRLRGVAGAWQQAAESFDRLRAIPGVRAYPGLTLQPGNLGAIDATLAALRARFPDLRHADLHVNLMHRSAHYFDNEAAPVADRAAMLRALQTFARAKGWPRDPVQAIERAFLALLPAHLASGRSPLPCRSGELSAYVSPSGTVHACTIDPRPAGELRAWGYDLRALWQSEGRRQLRASIAAGRCVGCWTPCEAYQTLLTSPVALGKQALRGQPWALRGQPWAPRQGAKAAVAPLVPQEPGSPRGHANG